MMVGFSVDPLLTFTTESPDVREINYLVKTLVSISCLISIAGSFLTIITFIVWPDIRTGARKILVYLSLSDLLASTANLYGTIRDFNSDTTDCIIQSVISTFGDISSFFWTMSLAVYMYVTIVKVDKTRADRLLCPFHAISWGIPIIIIIGAVLSGGLGYDASYISVGWCWVNLDGKLFLLWILLTGKLWEILAYIILPVLYCLVKKYIKIQVSGNKKTLELHVEIVVCQGGGVSSKPISPRV